MSCCGAARIMRRVSSNGTGKSMPDESAVHIDIEEYVVGSIDVAIRAMFELGKKQGLKFSEADEHHVVALGESLKLAVHVSVLNASTQFVTDQGDPTAEDPAHRSRR